MAAFGDRGTNSSPRVGRARRFQLLLGALVLLVVAYPYGDALLPWARPNLLLRVLVLLAALHALTDHRGIRNLGTVLCAVTVGGALWSTSSSAPAWAAISSLGCELAFYALTIAVVFTAVFHRERVRADTLYGAVSAYILVAVAFGIAYELLEQLAPGSFSLPQPLSGASLEAGLIYFSLVTFTTLGFGDITPVTAAARSLVIVQAVTGILFPAAMIARVVSLYTAGQSEVGFEPPAGSTLASAAARRFEILFGLQMLQLASYPYVPIAATRAIGVAILVAALYALPTGRRRRGFGALLAAPALLAWIWPGDVAASAPGLVGRTGLAAFLLFTTAALIQDVFSRKDVGRDVLFGAGCIYLLIGASWAAVYDLVWIFSPESFSLPGTPRAVSFLDMLYFSFIVLTTTGYGDILPQTTVVHSLVVLESMVGILFPAVLIARLVALYR